MKTVFADWRLWGYNCLLLLLSPYILWRKARRSFSRRTPHEFDWRRWACKDKAEYSAAGCTRLVFLCTGMGEVLIAAELTVQLQKQRGDLEIVWAIRRRDVEAWAQQKYPDQRTTTIPFDYFWPCRQWLRAMQPDVIVGIERLWLPNLFWMARHASIKTMVVAGTDFSRVTHPLWRRINRWTLRGLDKICLQSEAEKDKLADLLPPKNVCVTGALKWFESQPQLASPNAASLRRWMNSWQRPVLAAGSTHEGEEEFLLQAFKIVRRECDCALLIAPRQLHRVERIRELCRAAGWSVQQRSHLLREYSDAGLPAPAADVLLLDTMGELAMSYRLARAAFVGGTLRGTGHNLLEPLAAEVPVAFGAGGKNGRPTEMQQAVVQAGIGKRVETPEELAEYWKTILQSHEPDEIRHVRFENFRQSQLASWQVTVVAIAQQIDEKPLRKS